MKGSSREMKTVISDVIPTTSKITEHKLSGKNFLDWSKTIRIYLRSIDRDDHLTDDPPVDGEEKKVWLREDAKLFLQIRNSIDNEIVSLINHCEFVKELMDCEFVKDIIVTTSKITEHKLSGKIFLD